MTIDKGQIGGIVGGVGIIMLAMALAINNLSGDSAPETHTRCGWNEIEICSPLCQHEFFHHCSTTDSCHARSSGIIFFISMLAALLSSLVALLGVYIRLFNDKIKLHIRWMLLLSALCCIVAVTTWLALATDSCYDPDWSHRYLGASAILPMIACLMFVVAAMLVWTQHKIGYETLL